jgi:predicted Zn-dependent peptidase
LKEVEDQIEKVAAEDILELSKDIFQNESMSLTLLGPVDNERSHEWAFTL